MSATEKRHVKRTLDDQSSASTGVFIAAGNQYPEQEFINGTTVKAVLTTTCVDRFEFIFRGPYTVSISRYKINLL